MTKTLLDAVDEHSDLKLPRKARARISTLKGSIKTAAQADPERDIIFGDVHLNVHRPLLVCRVMEKMY